VYSPILNKKVLSILKFTVETAIISHSNKWLLLVLLPINSEAANEEVFIVNKLFVYEKPGSVV